MALGFTPWRILSNWGGSASASILFVGLGGSTLKLRIEHEETKERHLLTCHGVDASVGVTAFKWGVDGSVEQMPSGGIGRIYDCRWSKRPFLAEDFGGFATVITGTIKGLAGGSISTISFCRLPPVAPGLGPLSEKAVGFFVGMVGGASMGIYATVSTYYVTVD